MTMLRGVASAWHMRLVVRTVMVAVTCAAAVAGAAGCDRRPQVSPARGLTPEDEIREAVFRYELGRLGSAERTPDCYFLEVDQTGGDPSAALLARFVGHVPPVEAVSSAIGPDGMRGVRHKQNGGRGIVLTVRTIRHVDRDTAEVDAGHYESGISLEGNTYQLKRRDGRWTVTGSKDHWVS